MAFKKESYVRITDTEGNYRYGFISSIKNRGFELTIDFNEEGLSKVYYDSEYAQKRGTNATDFESLLTSIEKNVLVHIAALMTAKEIGVIMSMEPSTVRAHFRDIKHKLRIETFNQLIAYAQGLVSTGKITTNGNGNGKRKPELVAAK